MRKKENFFEKFSRETPTQRITAIFAIAAFIVALFLYCETRKQVAEAHRATDSAYSVAQQGMDLTGRIADSNNADTKKSLSISDNLSKSTTKSAVAAEESVRLNKQIARFNDSIAKLSLRSYVNVDFNSINYASNKSRMGANIQFVNSGKTPAYNIMITSIFHIVESRHDDMDSVIKRIVVDKSGRISIMGNVSYVVYGESVGNSVIGIGQSSPQSIFFNGMFGTVKKVDTQDSLDIVAGNKRLYLYASMVYDDIFKRPHHTNFCVLLNGSYHWKMYGNYNDSD